MSVSNIKEVVVYMKIKTALLLVSCLLLSGCGKIDDASQKIIDDINSIGDVSLTDQELIEKIEKTYSTLTDKQKDQINNYAILLEARDSLDELIKQAETQRLEQERLEKEKLYTPEVKYCASALVTVKQLTKNPDSVVFNEFCYTTLDATKVVYVDITGENGFGGSTRACYMVTDDETYGIYGALNTKTFLSCIDGDDAGVDTELIQLFAAVDKVDHDAVYQLVDEFEQTNDYSLIDYRNIK